jgi:hypothetical protein
MNEDNVQIKFANIEILSKTVNYISTEKLFQFYYEVSVDSKVRTDKKLILVLVKINLYHLDKRLLANFVVAYTFEITDFDTHIIQVEGGLYHIPDALDEMFKQVSISTTRGIIYSELRGTYLHSAIMPIAFPSHLVDEGEPSITT